MCTPAVGGSTSDANASGVFASVGSKQVPTEADPVAYYAKISIGTGVENKFTCEAWTGKHWLQIVAGGTGNCEPAAGIIDADAAGTFRAVGYGRTPTNEYPSAFEANAAVVTMFPANAPSWLFAMNSAGEAVGTTWYDPFGVWFEGNCFSNGAGEISPVILSGYSRVTVYWLNDKGDLLAELKTTSRDPLGLPQPLSVAPAEAR